MARLAQERGINANLLRKWIKKYLMGREQGLSLPLQDNSDDLASSRDVTNGVSVDGPGSRKLATLRFPGACQPSPNEL